MRTVHAALFVGVGALPLFDQKRAWGELHFVGGKMRDSARWKSK